MVANHVERLGASKISLLPRRTIVSSPLSENALEDTGKSMSELIGEVPQFITLREKVTCENDMKKRVLTLIEKNIKHAFPTFKDFSTVDGVRIALQEGWLLIRPSGTEPVIRVTVEGESPKAAREIMEKGKAVIHSAMNKKQMKAVIFAAGQGVRLLPITATRPKHLIKVGGKTNS